MYEYEYRGERIEFEPKDLTGIKPGDMVNQNLVGELANKHARLFMELNWNDDLVSDLNLEYDGDILWDIVPFFIDRRKAFKLWIPVVRVVSVENAGVYFSESPEYRHQDYLSELVLSMIDAYESGRRVKDRKLKKFAGRKHRRVYEMWNHMTGITKWIRKNS